MTSRALLGLAPPEAPPALAARTPKVLVVGVDGLRGDALARAETPTLRALAGGGALTLRGVSGDLAKSGANWSSIFTGVWRDRHGVDNNRFWFHDLDDWPDLFARLERTRPEAFSAFVYSWEKLHHFGRAADLRVFDDFEDCADTCSARAAVDLIERFPVDLLVVYLLGLDHAGHEFGFSGEVPEYRAALEAIDRILGALIAAIRARPHFAAERWLILVTTDHGGGGPGLKKHGANTPSDRDVLFLAAELPDGAPFELSPAPRQVDVVPTVLAHLGVPSTELAALDGRPLGALLELGARARASAQVINGDFELDRGLSSARVDVPPLGWRAIDCAIPRLRTSLHLAAAPGDLNVLAHRGGAPCSVEQELRLTRSSSGAARFELTARLRGAVDVRLTFGARRAPDERWPPEPEVAWSRDVARLAPESTQGEGCVWASGPVPEGFDVARVGLFFSGDGWIDDLAFHLEPSAEAVAFGAGPCPEFERRAR